MNQRKIANDSGTAGMLAESLIGQNVDVYAHERFPAPSLPKVAILLCSYHGQHYLTAQLDSFAAQTHSHWELWVSDDGSQDDTHAILQSYQRLWGERRLAIRGGPEEGFAANFLSLVCRTDIDAEYYAYADQDDIWDADKLERAVAWLKGVPTHVPALYCSRTRLVDADNNEIGLSPLFAKPPGFANALMQNIGGGNTMVFNHAARELLCKAGEKLPVVTHDWWTYMVVSGCGGEVCYDSRPSLRYRQHDGNVLGANSSWGARFYRIRMMWRGRYRSWNDANIEALNCLRDHLSPESKETLDLFSMARNRNLFSRLIGLKRSGVYRQTLLGNMGLILAAIFKRI